MLGSIIAFVALIGIAAQAAVTHPIISNVALTQPISAFGQRLVPDQLIDANIDSTITGQWRNLITAVMRELPADRRANVVYFLPDGRILSNHVALAAASRTYRIENGTYSDMSGHVYAVPRNDPMPPQSSRLPVPLYGTPPTNSGGTGAFRRVYSQPNFGTEDATFNAACNASHMSSTDTPYIYGGGWGNFGYAVDAGFQYGSDGRLTSFVKTQSSGQMNLGPYQLECGYPTTFYFTPLSNTQGYLSTIGTTTTGMSGYGDTLVFSLDPNGGWSQRCSGCVLKRMVSIAQKSENLSDQSNFAVAGNSPLINWTASTVGYVTSCNGSDCYGYTYQWTSYQGGYQSYPNDPSRVIANVRDAGHETDGIILHQ